MSGFPKLLTGIIVLVYAAMQASAQEQRKLPRMGILMSGSEASSRVAMDGLRKGLAEVGLAEGSGIVLDVKYADGRIDRLEAIANEIVNSRPNILFSGGDQGSTAIKKAAAGQLPIVAVTCDALAAGLVSNLARPGENLTGITCINADLAAKRVEIMKDLSPSFSRLGVALNPTDKRMVSELRESERAGFARSVTITALDVVKPDDIETVLAAAAQQQLGGVIFVFDAMTFFHRARVAKVAIERKLPTAFNFRQYVEAGGLFSYGPNLADMYRQSARHILKVIKGETAGDIPMEQPTRFELVVNLKTATAIGLTVPPSLVTRANDVIE